jgi:hypothetical protein
MQRTKSDLVFSEECCIIKVVDATRVDTVRLSCAELPHHGNAEGNPVPTPRERRRQSRSHPKGTPKAIPTFAT